MLSHGASFVESLCIANKESGRYGETSCISTKATLLRELLRASPQSQPRSSTWLSLRCLVGNTSGTTAASRALSVHGVGADRSRTSVDGLIAEPRNLATAHPAANIGSTVFETMYAAERTLNLLVAIPDRPYSVCVTSTFEHSSKE